MTNLQNKKAQIEMEIAKLQEELAQVEAQIVAEETVQVVTEVTAIEALATKVEADIEKFGTMVEEIVFNITPAEELALAKKMGLQDSFTVVTMNGNLEVNEDGTANLFNSYGDFVKSYKKVGSAVKALGKLS